MYYLFIHPIMYFKAADEMIPWGEEALGSFVHPKRPFEAGYRKAVTGSTHWGVDLGSNNEPQEPFFCSLQHVCADHWDVT